MVDEEFDAVANKDHEKEGFPLVVVVIHGVEEKLDVVGDVIVVDGEARRRGRGRCGGGGEKGRKLRADGGGGVAEEGRRRAEDERRGGRGRGSGGGRRRGGEGARRGDGVHGGGGRGGVGAGHEENLEAADTKLERYFLD